MSERTLSPREDELHVACMRAIQDLAQTYNSGLSIKAIEVRMSRIADDLKAVVYKDNGDQSW